ncbi:MAG: hypothetical protein PHX21_01390 [bacterium]|nr:hypothetical protein [bacterium]
MRKRILLKILPLSVILLSGCTTSIVDTGETLPPHKIEAGISTLVNVPYDPTYLYNSNLYLKLGVADNLDSELRVSNFGMIGCLKARLIKDPVTFSIGGGLGFNFLGAANLEATAYLSKRIDFATPYIACRYNIMTNVVPPGNSESFFSYSYPLIACGASFSLTYWLELLGEIDVIPIHLEEESYSMRYGSIRFNFHNLKKKTPQNKD